MSSAADTVRVPVSGAPASPRIPWRSISFFGVLLILCYAPVLWRLAVQWQNDEDMGHGFFVIPIALYIAWQRREELFSRPARRNYWGLVLMAYAVVQLMVGTLGVELFLSRTAFLFSLAGAILFAGGMHAIRTLAFPLLLLIFMVPIPGMVYAQITLPLQTFASWVAEQSLSLLSVPVLRDGNVLQLPSQTLNVVEACSGIRSLLSLSFLGLVYAYFFDSRTWMRWVLFALTIPIAIIANAGRVTLTGLLSEINPEWAQGFFHSASGWVIFMIALAILIAAHQAINLGSAVYARVRR